MDEFAQELSDIIANVSIDQKYRDLAQSVLSNWINGITPSRKTIRILRQVNQKPLPCEKEQHNGGCGWLRERGKYHNLYVPPIGQPALCTFRDEQYKCPGYRGN